MPYAQLVIGPAGSGKSTYCSNIQQHCHSIGRTIHVINLDPAADASKYSVTSDVRDLINLDEVMEEEELGPNGALMFCMEYLEDNLDDWLAEELEGYLEDDMVIFDCPGQLVIPAPLGVSNVHETDDGLGVEDDVRVRAGFCNSSRTAQVHRRLSAGAESEMLHSKLSTPTYVEQSGHAGG